ncbi:helix-turn-helix domain-containing protein [Streptomyces sp. 8K308]|uniref:GlxA family transcriptional regulator n=1 Tax=Streptomyces sp. 8K308 TaxID=2530388 RepID=UPI0010539A89|nr:helix-turn-helix domain-containing protein [Streptomyces sp. 8K308]TDC13426.1 helix-turn-helix domain-containing protein [Streptomyces sp. 8K308]
MVTLPKNPATGEAHPLAVLVQPGVVPLDLVIPLQVFGPWPAYVSESLGGLKTPYRLDLVGPGTAVGDLLQVGNVQPLSRLADAQTIVVPGTSDPTAPPDPATVEALLVASKRGARILSICTGAFTVAATGLLDGRRATTHWQWAPELRARYPRVTVVDRELYIDEGQIVTSAGVLAGTDLCLHVLRTDHGQYVANTLARYLVSPPHREGGQAQYSSERPERRSELSQTTDWILDHLGEQLTVERVAAQAHVSVRTLSRRFRSTFGVSVMEWVARQRVSRAREFLETTDRTIADIAHACGFGSVESLRVHFMAQTMTSPSRYRSTFG